MEASGVDSSEEVEEPSFLDSAKRQLGLTARAGGPTAVGAGLGAVMGAPLAGVGAVPGAAAGALAMQIVQMIDEMGGTNYIDQAMDKLGLPRPATKEERQVQAGAKAIAGMGGLAAATRAAMPTMSQTTRAMVEPLTTNLGTGGVAAASGGVAGEMAAQEGMNPTEQFIASTAASAVAPLAVAGVQGAGRLAARAGRDVVDTTRAAFGDKGAAERITADVIKTLTEGETADINKALSRGTKYVHGTKPTVGEFLAQENLQDPTKQTGGALIKMQDELTGGKGIEDLIPSVLKRNQQALELKRQNIDKVTTPMREEAFNLARQGGNPSGVGVAMDVMLLGDRPGYRASTLAQKVLTSTAKKLTKVTNPQGKIDVEDLYMIRKELGSEIERFSKETANFDKKLTSGILSDVQGSIDKAIVDSGVPGWKAYLNTYNEGMERIRRHEGRLTEMNRIAGATTAIAPGELVKGELPTIPTLLHRPTMAVNFALKLIAKDATVPIVRELAQRMTDPKEFMSLMNRPGPAPAKKMAQDILLQASTLVNLMQRHQADIAAEETE